MVKVKAKAKAKAKAPAPKLGPWTRAKTIQLRKRWIEALEGKRLWLGKSRYKQTEGNLHVVTQDAKHHAFCCLGVLCEEYIAMGGRLKVSTGERGVFYNGEDGELPSRVGRAVGMKFDADETLIGYNDYGQWTFKRIAKALRTKPHEFFKALPK